MKIKFKNTALLFVMSFVLLLIVSLTSCKEKKEKEAEVYQVIFGLSDYADLTKLEYEGVVYSAQIEYKEENKIEVIEMEHKNNLFIQTKKCNDVVEWTQIFSIKIHNRKLLEYDVLKIDAEISDLFDIIKNIDDAEVKYHADEDELSPSPDGAFMKLYQSFFYTDFGLIKLFSSMSNEDKYEIELAKPSKNDYSKAHPGIRLADNVATVKHNIIEKITGKLIDINNGDMEIATYKLEFNPALYNYSH